MRFLRKNLVKIKLFKYKKTETDYPETVDVPVFSERFEAKINGSENKLGEELYGKNKTETLSLLCEYPLNAKCGDGIALNGKSPTHRITSFTGYDSYAELCAEKISNSEKTYRESERFELKVI